MITPTKALAIVGALGTTAGGGLLLSQSSLFSKPQVKTTLKNEVENDKWIFLTTKNKSELSTIQSAYKETNPKATLLFFGLTGSESDFSDKLLQECKSLYEKESNVSSKDDLLKQLKKWCVIPKTVKQRLKDLDYNPFPTDGPTQGTTETAEWKNMGERHGSAQKDKFAEVSLTGNNDQTAKALRTHCAKALAMNSFEESFQNTLEKVTLWCSLKVS